MPFSQAPDDSLKYPTLGPSDSGDTGPLSGLFLGTLWADLALPATSASFGVCLTWATLFLYQAEWGAATIFAIPALLLLVAVGGMLASQYLPASEPSEPSEVADHWALPTGAVSSPRPWWGHDEENARTTK